jgi:3-deoxy-7-phosphoheptulonate synthase
MGYDARSIPGGQRTAVGIIGNDGGVDAGQLQGLEGVLEVIPVTHPYKQVSREWQEEDTVVSLANGTSFGGSDISVIAGPCAVEGEAEILDIAHQLRAMGATVLRGGKRSSCAPRRIPSKASGWKDSKCSRRPVKRQVWPSLRKP